MSQQLRGTPLPKPTFRLGPMPAGLKQVNGYKNLKTYFPALGRLGTVPSANAQELWYDTTWTTTAIDCSGTSGVCTLTIESKKDGVNTKTRAYLKATHLLNPIRWIEGKYSLPGHPVAPRMNKTWKDTLQKLNDSWNQAYVDALACYALGRLREAGASPHFNQFYGAFVATADTYSYNLTEEIDSYRHSKWFWTSEKKGLYSLRIVNAMDPTQPVPEEYLQELEEIRKEMEAADESEEESASEEELEEIEEDSEKSVDLESAEPSDASDASDELSDIDAAGADMGSLHSDDMGSLTTKSENEEGEESSAEDEDEVDYRIYCDIKEFPVMLILTEENSGTMDSLLDNHAEIGAVPSTYEWDQRWSAWLFQILAALSCAQELLGLTHNDLHTNNIVWSSTPEEYLWYTRRDGTTFKVPTFGKLFRIIDFGRSIYYINGTAFISDDFRPENDAAGQYRFKPLNKTAPRNPIPPNPSFDLSRLAVSLFSALFPDTPVDKENGRVLSSEDGLLVQESISDLYNVLWSWMIDDEGANILINPDGSEKFPDFDLYKHIAAYVHGAVPSRQFTHPAFDRFQVQASEVPIGAHKWSLFC